MSNRRRITLEHRVRPGAANEERRDRSGSEAVTSSLPLCDRPADSGRDRGARALTRRAGKLRDLLLLAPTLLLAACASVPTGPSTMALPGSKSSFERFRADDFNCQQFATARVGGKTRDDVAMDAAVKSAVVGAAIGAVAGAAIDGGSGAAVGAGLGAATGALVGTDAAGYSSRDLQRRYDEAYLQCMYAKGHKVPVYGDFASPYERPRASRGYYPPPPPAGVAVRRLRLDRPRPRHPLPGPPHRGGGRKSLTSAEAGVQGATRRFLNSGIRRNDGILVAPAKRGCLFFSLYLECEGWGEGEFVPPAEDGGNAGRRNGRSTATMPGGRLE